MSWNDNINQKLIYLVPIKISISKLYIKAVPIKTLLVLNQ